MTYYLAAEFLNEDQAKEYLEDRKTKSHVVSSKILHVRSSGYWQAITEEDGNAEVTNDDY